MEIPIQVAVRICPVGLHTFKPDIIEDNKDKVNDVTNDQIKINKKKEYAENTDEKYNRSRCCVQAIPLTTTAMPYLPGGTAENVLDNGISLATGIIQVGRQSFPVTHALQFNCTQSQVYHQTVFPLINLFMEGFDASVVTYGQRRSGKTFTLYGDCFNDKTNNNENNHGVVQRCVREIFIQMSNHPERTYVINIAWVEICGEVINDILGVGSAPCSTILDVFHWLKVGFATLAASKKSNVHTLFTITLEQHWVSKEGLIQHRLSTVSFSDLTATERLFMLNSLEQPTSLPKDSGLQSLEQVVNVLANPSILYESNSNVPYNQATLTTLLKDSFGGRAQTLFILCVSPFERDVNETLCNLQFATKVQCVRNFVLLNTFSDDNTPITAEGIIKYRQNVPKLNVPSSPGQEQPLDGQFTPNQWFKLVSNAECLLSKLMSSYSLTNLDKEQIEQWLFLKQECEDCLTSNEMMRSQKQLGPIQESEEPNGDDDDGEYVSETEPNSDNESDLESQRADLEEKLDALMEDFTLKTNTLVKTKYEEFMKDHPKGVMESQERVKDDNYHNNSENTKSQEKRLSVTGRRKSLQPGTRLSSADMAMLHEVAYRGQNRNNNNNNSQSNDDFSENSSEIPLRSQINSPVEQIEKKLRKLNIDIDAKLRQITEIEETINLKENIISELLKHSETRCTAKQKFHKKRAKLESEYERTKKTLAKAIVQGRDKQECEKLKSILAHLEQRLQDITSIKHIAGDGGQKLKKIQKSLQESKKLLNDVQKKVKKEFALKETLENELKNLKEIGNSKKPTGKNELSINNCQHSVDEKGNHLKEVQARISHLDHILKEKSDHLEKFGDDEQRETLRHEIRNLRRTRDHLLEERCSLDRKLKREKSLTQKEERKLLECDEAIEAIDAAIEYKNELICGHKSIDTSDRLKREKGEQMLMARLNKLSLEEMRTMLYKYFTKVIDLRDSSRKLEIQVLQLERERDTWEWKERVLSNAVRQARLEGERNAVLLQRQHEMQKALILRHLVDETSNSSNSVSDNISNHNYLSAANLQLANAMNSSADTTMTSTSTTTTTATTTNNSAGHLNVSGTSNPKYSKPSAKLNDIEMCPTNGNNNSNSSTIKSSKSLDKFKEKSRETKNKLFKFQMLSRCASGISGANQAPTPSSNVSNNEDSLLIMPSTSSNYVHDNHHYHHHYQHYNQHITPHNWRRGKDKVPTDVNATNALAIPQENLKKLTTTGTSMKVTRQKNKIIIQDNSRKN